MVATTQNRNTAKSLPSEVAVLPTANTVYYSGTIAGVDSGTGLAVVGAASTTIIAPGIVKYFRDFRTGAQPNVGPNATRVTIEYGVGKFANSAGADEIDMDDLGADCYIVDNQTVALTNGSNTRSRAGRVFFVDDDGSVLVQFGV